MSRRNRSKAPRLNFRTKWGEVSAEIQAVMERSQEADLNIIAIRVLNNHPEIKGKDSDFHLCCSMRAIRKEVLELKNRRRVKDDDAPVQAKFDTDGFEYLKMGYAVDRDGHQLHLPLDQLTDLELLAKADEYDAMSDSLRKEAAELRRYVSLRQAHRATPLANSVNAHDAHLHSNTRP